MQNEAGEYADKYIPRKCSASNWLIAAKDHAAVQIDLAELNPETGVASGEIKRYTICGRIRSLGESDSSLVRLACRDGIIGNVIAAPGQTNATSATGKIPLRPVHLSKLDQFGLDEPLLDEVQQQNYSAFLLDQPIDFFDDLNSPESEESPSIDLASPAVIDEYHSSTRDSFVSQITNQELPVFRRDSSDESDMGIVDDIIVPTKAMPLHRPSANSGSIVGAKRSVNGATIVTTNQAPRHGSNDIDYRPQITLQQTPVSAHVKPTVIKLEPIPPRTPLTLPVAVVDDKKPILPKPCLVMSPNGALTPLHLQQTNKFAADVKSQQPAITVKNRANMTASEIQQQQDEMERLAKKQLRIIKNREAATLSRQRQKAYLQSLEQRVKQLAQENEQFRQQNEEMRRLVDRLHEENVCLRNGTVASSTGSIGTAFSPSGSVSSRDEFSPVPLSESQTITSSAPSSPPVLQVRAAPVSLSARSSSSEDEPASKKQIFEPSVPVITVPVCATVHRDSKTTAAFISAVQVEKKKASSDAASTVLSSQQPPLKRIFIPSRPSNKTLLVFSLIFAFNCIPFATRLMRESSTDMSSPVQLSGPTDGELSYLKKENIQNQPGYSGSSRTLDGGHMKYPVNRRPARQVNDLVIFSSKMPNENFLGYDHDLPLMDDALLEDDDDDRRLQAENCPSGSVNTTHSQRIVNALSHWASLQQLNKANKTKPQPQPFADRVSPTFRKRFVQHFDNVGSSGLQLYRRRSAHTRQQRMWRSPLNPPGNVDEVADDADYSSLAQYEKFAKTIRQRNDSFYMVSFHVDQLIFPALVNNRTSRPKMSLILPALFSLNETVSPPDGSVALMQIECEVSDMKILHLGKHLIPFDIVLRQMRQGEAHADATNRMYRQWLYGNKVAPGSA